MAEHSFNSLMRRLSRAGFKRTFVSTALMPEWWDESCSQDPNLLPEIEIRVARFLDAPLAAIRNVEMPLEASSFENAQLRRVRNVDRDRFNPAIHSAIQITGAVIRSLRSSNSVEMPPADALEWRQILRASQTRPIHLDCILRDLWDKGIPVIPLEVIPAPSFQGLACIVDGRPAIVLGHRYEQPGRVAFLVAHEAGHIASGDCSPDVPVVDQDEDVMDSSEMESEADRFAKCLLLGDVTIASQLSEHMDAKTLAQEAFDLESKTGADASSIIYSWASRTLDYPIAELAVRALYRSAGARRQVRRVFDEYVDLESAGESDRELLRCIYGDAEPAAPAN